MIISIVRCAIPDNVYTKDTYQLQNATHSAFINFTIPRDEDGELSKCYIYSDINYTLNDDVSDDNLTYNDDVNVTEQPQENGRKRLHNCATRKLKLS